MASYRERPEEVFGMYSAVLKEFDDNTVKYMIEEQQKEIDEQQRLIEQKDKMIAKLQAQLLRQNK